MANNSIDRIPRDNVNYWLADHAAKHRNLLDNPFFTVNSREIDSETGVTASGTNVFCLDRWKVNRGTVKTLVTGGVSYVNTDAGQYKRFFQSISTRPSARDELTITVHCKVNSISGNWYFSTFGADEGMNYQTSNIIAIPSTSGEYWIDKTFYVPSGYTGLNAFGVGVFNNVAGDTIDIEIYCIKVERGNYSTLKMDYPPNYYDEVIKCKTATVDANDAEANKTIFEELTEQSNAIDQKQDATSYVTLSGTIVTQTGADNTMYLCGELAELTFTAPATGQTAIRFSSGTTPTVATFSGVTWLNGFDPTAIEASKTYEVNILNGLGVAAWT